MKIFLATPTHDGRVEFGTANALRNATAKHEVIQVYNQSSLLAYNCNQLWCMALNMRKQHDIKYFAMLHSDVIPEKLWLDKLIDIAEEHEMDLVSAVVPIKDDSGDTSTAIGNKHRYFRLHKEYFIDKNLDSDSEKHLLVNTGCMVVRFDFGWTDKLFFTINDRIGQDINGNYVARVDPEDWNFSRQVKFHGGKIMATRAISLEHVGSKRYKF